MGKKKKTSHGDILTWLGIGLLCIASIADVLIIFTDNYTRNLLLTVPLWFAGFACFVLIGQQENKKKKQRKAGK
ncbi:hypothetical protein QS713_00395 [Gleimia hominis]|uniref:Uncharacterized protein n=1 Tax=Gleimia hominis TaxID=595468 RepID=A0ABU3I827_9ACTO|nr:hypothetical protein [Gleimia hominis]MDT3766534.1 hypothetical protein [Gleimia hominis]